MKTTPFSAYNLHDLERLARRRLPKGIFEYIQRGVEDEVALRENRAAFERLRLRPRVMRDVGRRSARAKLLGQEAAMPVAIAPTGSAGLVWYHGELELARAAAAQNVPFTLATNAMTSIETVAKQAGGRLWFQLNMFADRQVAYDMIARAAANGFEALVLTVDCVIVPNREYNARNGFALPFHLSWRSATDMLSRPGWFSQVMLRYLFGSGLPRFENFPAGHQSKVTGFSNSASVARCEDLTWHDLTALRERWPGKLIVKGVLHPDDAAQSVALGADAVVVSNHGGRTVDSTIAPLDALPAIVARIGGKATVLLDSGIRRGSDVIKARALGADGVLIGRPTLYGTALGGQAGAEHALRLLRTEIERELGLMGYTSLDDVDTELLASIPRQHGPLDVLPV